MAGFTYIKNSFYIEADEKSMNDSITISNYLRGGTYSAKEDFINAINLDHEMNHYVQELFINGCISEGFFRDYLSAYARELSHNDNIRFPLAEQNNAKYNKSLQLEGEDYEMLSTFYELYEVYDYIYNQAHYKPQTEEYYYSNVAEPLFQKYSIKFIHLIETYAYHKAFWDYYARNESGEGAELLHQILVDDKVYPVRWRNQTYEIQDFKHDIEWKDRYQLVNLMLLVGLPFGDSHRKHLEYCEKEIPHNYRNSPSVMTNSAQRIIFETALNIPSVSFIMYSLKNGLYDREVFSPVHRFYKILKNIREYGGYPDAVKGEDFFITFFNWSANLNGWPTYEETHNSIVTMLYERAEKGQEAITNFQLLAVAHKNSHYGRWAQDFPIETLSILNLPLLIRTQNSFSIFQMMNNYIFDRTIEFYHVMFNTEKILKYKPLAKDMEQQEQLETVFQNGQAAIREVLNRLFSGAAFKAYVEKGKFSCPLHKSGCSSKCEACGRFINFDDVFVNCKKNILRFGPIKSFQPDGKGNIPDCMFFNYLIDYNYNLNKIQNGTAKKQ